MIKAVIFDCFGVLTSDTWKEFLTTVDQNQRDEIRSVHMAYDKGFISYTDFRKQLTELTKVANSVIDNIFIHRSEKPKNTQLLEYIKSLGEKYKVSILSNVGTDWIRESFLTSQETVLFTDMVLSFEVGLSKPDPAIFRLACERLSVVPQEAVFIDDIPSYCQAAEALGMKAVAYRNFDQFRAELTQILADTNN